MDTTGLPRDFSEFLRLLTIHGVRYLLVGGYAVAYHGYVRATADLDVWINRTEENAARLVKAVSEFGFGIETLTPQLFMKVDRVVRMGNPPFRIEILTSVSGLAFDDAFPNRIPFNPTTTIPFDLAENGEVEITVFDVLGRRVLKRDRGSLAAGRYQQIVDMSRSPAGSISTRFALLTSDQ